MAKYSPTSPYFKTQTHGNYLDVMKHRDIKAGLDDTLYTIQQVYEYRPDMLAFDLYGDSGLWWVFANRNPNTLQDPIYDFIAGQEIYVPKQSNINTALGL